MTPRPPRDDEAYVGLGGNVGDREAALCAAIEALGACVVAVGPLVETEPWGILDQAWFLNGVVRLRWTEGPEALLARCLVIEAQLGRVRAERNGPRVLDLDVLLVGPSVRDAPGLTVPHPGIAHRRSVLEPFAALAPDLLVPGLDLPLALLRQRAEALPGQRVRLPAGAESLQSGTLDAPRLEE